MENKNVAVVKTDEKRIFKLWLKFVKPFHNLTESEMDVTALFLFHRHRLKKIIKDTEYLNKFLFSTESRTKIREELGLSTQRFHNVLTNLRKKGVVVDNEIAKQYLPNLPVDGGEFQVVIKFQIDGKR